MPIKFNFIKRLILFLTVLGGLLAQSGSLDAQVRLRAISTVGGGATPAFVQGTYTEAVSTSVSINLTSNVTAGNLLVVVMRPSGGQTSSCTYNGQTFTSAAFEPGSSAFSFQVLYLPNATASAANIVCTISPSDMIRAHAAEFSGVATTSPVTTTAQGTSAVAQDTFDVGNVTTTVANSLIFLAIASDGDSMGGTCGDTCDPTGTGYTNINLQALDDDKSQMMYRVEAATGSYATLVTNNDERMGAPQFIPSEIVVVFKP